MDALEPGDPRSLGGYALQGRLGAGGQGVVYLGRTASGAPVAVKTLNAASVADPVARRRFASEVALVRQVSSFCVAEVVDADLDGERPYIVSEYVEGPSLWASVTERGPLSGGSLHRLAVGSMTALAAIHAAGIVHRDFKPHNVLLGRDGPRVVDFGIARLLDSATTAVTGQVVGTLSYMSPEQLSGGHLEASSDMFAWAATMGFAAGGRPPFGRDTIPAIMHRILYAEPELPALPRELDQVVRSCLAKDPRDRPAARDVLLRLIGDDAPAATGASAARTAPVPVMSPSVATLAPATSEATRTETPPKRHTRRRLWLAVALASAVAAVGVAAMWWPDGSGTTKKPPQPTVSGTALYKDDFSERRNWDGYNYNPTATGDEKSDRGYELSREVYSMHVDKNTTTNASLSPVPAKNATTTERNVAFGASAAIQKAQGRGSVGLLCRWNEDAGKGYMFLLDREGAARVVRHAGGVDQEVGSPGRVTALETGKAVGLWAACRQDGSGTRVTFWVNGVQVIDATDSPGLPDDRISQVGLYLQIPESNTNGDLAVSFDDFALYRPN